MDTFATRRTIMMRGSSVKWPVSSSRITQRDTVILIDPAYIERNNSVVKRGWRAKQHLKALKNP